MHVSVSNLYRPRIGLHISSCRIGRPIVEIYKSLTDAWMWKLGLRPRYSYSGKICFEMWVFCLCSVGPVDLKIHTLAKNPRLWLDSWHNLQIFSVTSIPGWGRSTSQLTWGRTWASGPRVGRPAARRTRGSSAPPAHASQFGTSPAGTQSLSHLGVCKQDKKIEFRKKIIANCSTRNFFFLQARLFKSQRCGPALCFSLNLVKYWKVLIISRRFSTQKYFFLLPGRSQIKLLLVDRIPRFLRGFQLLLKKVPEGDSRVC